MRIDKFLKISRIIKRRVVAKEVTEQERIYINDRPVKPSKEVKIGDIVKILFGNKIVTIKVLDLNEKATKISSSSLYELVNEEYLKDED